jgi:hypothetical protein
LFGGDPGQLLPPPLLLPELPPELPPELLPLLDPLLPPLLLPLLLPLLDPLLAPLLDPLLPPLLLPPSLPFVELVLPPHAGTPSASAPTEAVTKRRILPARICPYLPRLHFTRSATREPTYWPFGEGGSVQK